MDATRCSNRLAAILAADAAGYSCLMAADEHATVAALHAARAVFRTQIESRQGRVIDMAGDERRLHFRIGLHLGDLIEKPDGSVHRAGGRLRVTAQLIDATTGHHLWGGEVRPAHRRPVRAAGRDHRQPLRSARSGDRPFGNGTRTDQAAGEPGCLGTCQRGWRHLQRFTRQDFDEAERCLRRAHEIDGTVSQPLAGLAQLSMWRGCSGGRPRRQRLPRRAQRDGGLHRRGVVPALPRGAAQGGLDRLIDDHA